MYTNVGIIGSGQIYGTSTDHPVTFNQITKETEVI